MPKLTPAQTAQCDAPLSLEELRAALHSSPDNKTPGIDGLPANFYKVFAPQLLPIVLDVFNECIVTGILPPSVRKAVIVLLYKKGNASMLGNYRPLSMLTSDYKLLAKLLSKRLDLVIDVLIHPDQTGFIKRRVIQENIQLVRGIIQRHRLDDIPGLLLFLDQYKAFDTMLWDYTGKIL